MKSQKGASAAGESTFHNALAEILSRADLDPLPVYNPDDICGWPAGLFDILQNAGILQETSLAHTAVCDGCELACIEDVLLVDQEDRSPRAYIACNQREDIGRVAVSLDKLRQWQINLVNLANTLSYLLGKSPGAKEILEGRFWSLGTIGLRKKQTSLFLCRFAEDADPASTIKSATSSDISGHTIVLTLSSAPHILLPGHIRTTPAAKILDVHKGRFEISKEIINRLAGSLHGKQAQKIVPVSTPPGTTWEQVQITFMNPENVQIQVGDQVENRNFSDLGFADLRKAGDFPDSSWEHLRSLAAHRGKWDWDTPEINEEDRSKVTKWISDIRRKLQLAFPDIGGNPFLPYIKVKSYQTRFSVGGSTEWD